MHHGIERQRQLARTHPAGEAQLFVEAAFIAGDVIGRFAGGVLQAELHMIQPGFDHAIELGLVDADARCDQVAVQAALARTLQQLD